MIVQKYPSLSLGALEISSRRFQTGCAPARWFGVPVAEDEEVMVTEDEAVTVDGLLPASVSESGIWRVWCLESVYRLLVYFLLSEEVFVELVLLCGDTVMPVSGREMCSILSMSAVFDLKKKEDEENLKISYLHVACFC